MTLPNFEIVCHILQVMEVSKLILVTVHCDRTLKIYMISYYGYPEDGNNTLVNLYQTAWCHISEDSNLDIHSHVNVRSYIFNHGL